MILSGRGYKNQYGFISVENICILLFFVGTEKSLELPQNVNSYLGMAGSR